jgi:predicted permease
LSGLPSANGAFVLANAVGIGTDIASSMVFWTLILIVPVLIFWFFILDHFQLFPEAE